MRHFLLPVVTVALLPFCAQAQDGERVAITGEFIDTWCYFSG